jgi:pSer/pThr/pTyr-binding forkhead associated (FHA) protein
MAVTVVVRSASPDVARGADAAPSLTFDGDRVVLGRGAGSDVRLPDPSVSMRHATIRRAGSDFAIVDEGSTNGTWVGGVKLSPHTPRLVRTGDLVRLGRVWLELSVGQRPATTDLGLATRDLALALVRRAMNAVGDETAPRVVVVEGPDVGADLRLLEEGRAYVIGRAEESDLPLADADASREHAVMVRRGGQVLLRDNQAKNGVWLGDQRLTPGRDVPWRAPLMVRIGATVIAIEEPVSAVLADLEAAEDERIRDEDAPDAPAPLSAGASSQDGSGTAPEPPPPSRMPESLAAAPIADVVAAPARKPPVAGRAWSATDLLVVFVALAVIGASLVGLVWIVRGS